MFPHLLTRALATTNRTALTRTSAITRVDPTNVNSKYFAPSLSQEMNVRISRCRNITELEALVSSPQTEFSAANCAAAFTKLGKLLVRSKKDGSKGMLAYPERWRTALYRHLRGQTFSPREIADICQGFAQTRLDVKIPWFVQFDSSLDLTKFSAQDLVLLVWSFAKLGHSQAEAEDVLLFDRVQAEVLSRDLRTWNATQLSNLCWSFANMSRDIDPARRIALFQRVGDEIAHGRGESLTTFSEHDLSTLVHSFARMGFKHTDLFARIASVMVHPEWRSLNTFSAQGLATIVWGFATLGLREQAAAGALLEKVSFHLQHTRVLRDVDAFAVSQILWAHSALGRRDAALFEFLLRPMVTGAREKHAKFELRTLLRILQSLAKQHDGNSLSQLQHEFAALVAAQLSAELNGAEQTTKTTTWRPTSHDLVMLLWSFASSKYYDSALFHRVALALDVSQMDSQDASNVLWAFATAAHQSSNFLVLRLVEEMCQPNGLRGFSCQAICNICWSLVSIKPHAEVLRSPAVQRFFQLRLPSDDDGFAMEYFVEHATQLDVAQTVWRAVMPHQRSALLDELCAGGWIAPLLRTGAKKRN